MGFFFLAAYLFDSKIPNWSHHRRFQRWKNFWIYQGSIVNPLRSCQYPLNFWLTWRKPARQVGVQFGCSLQPHHQKLSALVEWGWLEHYYRCEFPWGHCNSCLGWLLCYLIWISLATNAKNTHSSAWKTQYCFKRASLYIVRVL